MIRSLVRHAAVVWMLVVGTLLGGCALTPDGRPMSELAAEINATLWVEPGKLGPGDTLDIRFPNFPAWNHNTLVRPDGRATFLSIDDVQVSGLTVEELDLLLTDRYSKTLAQPDVTILVTQVATVRNVNVAGEVVNPGIQPFDAPRLTLIDAIARAGGFHRQFAYPKQTLLVRWNPRTSKNMAWKIDASKDYWYAPEAVLLQPGDLVYVPHKPIVEVDIWVDQYIRLMIPFPQFYGTAAY